MRRISIVPIAIVLVAAGAGGADGQEAAPATREVRVCEVVGGELRETTHTVSPGADTTYSHRQPPPGPDYATNAMWFIDNEPITFNGRRYVKYGLPRVVGVAEVSRVGAYRGVSLFAETGAAADRPEALYVPVRPGCEFQVYLGDLKAGGVRG